MILLSGLLERQVWNCASKYRTQQLKLEESEASATKKPVNEWMMEVATEAPEAATEAVFLILAACLRNFKHCSGSACVPVDIVYKFLK